MGVTGPGPSVSECAPTLLCVFCVCSCGAPSFAYFHVAPNFWLDHCTTAWFRPSHQTDRSTIGGAYLTSTNGAPGHLTSPGNKGLGGELLVVAGSVCACPPSVHHVTF